MTLPATNCWKAYQPMANAAWDQYKKATIAMGKWTNRKVMRDLLRSEPELRTVRRGAFGSWRTKI